MKEKNERVKRPASITDGKELTQTEKSRGPDRVPEMLGAGGTSSAYFYGIGGE